MRFCFEQTLPIAREVLFAFFENPERLAMLHAGWSHVRLLHHETRVRVGAETWVEVTVAGFVPVVLGFRHFLFEPPVRFGEQAIHGPFSRFIHVHEFTFLKGATVLRDLLDIALPWYYGGETIMRRLVSPVVKNMFRGRAQVLSHLLREGVLAHCPARPASARGG